MSYKIKVQLENDLGETLLDTDYPITGDSTEMLEMDLLKFQKIVAQDIEDKLDEEDEKNCIGHDENPNASAEEAWNHR